MKTLRAAGWPWKDIAAVLGVNPPVIRRRARLLGFDTSVYLSSGTLTGRAVVSGVRPQPQRFHARSLKARLGKMWARQ